MHYWKANSNALQVTIFSYCYSTSSDEAKCLTVGGEVKRNEREGRGNGRGKRGEVNEGKRKAGEGGLRRIG